MRAVTRQARCLCAFAHVHLYNRSASMSRRQAAIALGSNLVRRSGLLIDARAAMAALPRHR